jgi:hypothetical protein
MHGTSPRSRESPSTTAGKKFIEAYFAEQERQAKEIERVVRSAQSATSLQKRLEERRASLLK